MGGLKMPPVESAKTSRLVFENAKKGLNALKKPYNRLKNIWRSLSSSGQQVMSACT
ncbi:hypothetical protein FOFC_19140 [Fusarium oxysporum]|nr:hypothetical protein FOFC_19140 [Fusarium oxysporum]